MQTPIKLQSFSAVGAGQTANLVLAGGVTYDAIYIETNVPPAQITYVELKLNANEVFSLSGDELVMLDQFDEVYSAFAGPTYRYALPLQIEYAVLADVQRQTGLVIGPGDNCVINVKIDGAAVTPVMSAFAETSAMRGARNVVRTFQRYTVPVAAAGITEFFNLNKGNRLLRAHFKSADMSSLEIVRDRLKIYELDKARNDYLLERAGRTVQAGYFHFDPTKHGYPVIDSMSTVANDLVFRLGMDAGGNVEVLVERYDNTTMTKSWQEAGTAQAAASAPANRRRGIGRG